MRRTAMMVMTVAVLVVALSGVALAARLSGTEAGDLIRGTSNDDVLQGLGGNDALHGMGGDDFLYGNRGHDGLYGGAGIDVIHGGEGDDRAEERAVHGGSGGDVLYGEGGEDALYGGPGDDLVISTGVVTVLFAAMYKFLPDVKIGWHDVWVGALMTGVLFQVGKYALTIYFHFSAPASAYGAAGSLIALLIWLYYSAQILFFGAEVTQVYARKFGSGIQPTENAMAVTEAERANRGLAPGATTKKAPAVTPPPPRPVVQRPIFGNIPSGAMKRPLAFGGGGVVAGLLLGAAGAIAMKRRRTLSPRTAAALELDNRLHAVEQRMQQIKGLYDTAYNLNRPAPKRVEVPVEKVVEVPVTKVVEVPKPFAVPMPVPQPPRAPSWRTALHNTVWKHPALWPIAKAFQLYKLTAR